MGKKQKKKTMKKKEDEELITSPSYCVFWRESMSLVMTQSTRNELPIRQKKKKKDKRKKRKTKKQKKKTMKKKEDEELITSPSYCVFWRENMSLVMTQSTRNELPIRQKKKKKDKR